jgi:hypothetical protein
MLDLLAMIEFDYPARLIWLALLPLLAYFAWHSLSTLPRPRRLASFVCRALAVTLLVLAFAGSRVARNKRPAPGDAVGRPQPQRAGRWSAGRRPVRRSRSLGQPSP